MLSKWLLWRVKALWPHRLLQLESEREPGDEVARSTSTLQSEKKKQQRRWQRPLQKHSSEVGELHTDTTGATLSTEPQPQSVASSPN